MSARLFSYQTTACTEHYKDYDWVCWPISTFEQNFGQVLIFHIEQKSTGYFLGVPTPVSADSFGGIEVCGIGDHLGMVDHYRETKKHEGITLGWSFGARLSSMD